MISFSNETFKELLSRSRLERDELPEYQKSEEKYIFTLFGRKGAFNHTLLGFERKLLSFFLQKMKLLKLEK